jgi:hypothetical protein
MEAFEARRETSLLLRAVADIHEGQDGLENLGKLVGAVVKAPRVGKKVYVGVLGHGLGPAQLIEKYTGKAMQNKGLGTENQFTVIEYGASKNIERGGTAIGKLPGADRLHRVSGLEKSFAVEQMESTRLDFELVNFVRFPLIEGTVRGDKASVDDAIERVREALTDTERHGSLKKIFQDIDVNSDGGISQQEFIAGIEKLQLGIKIADLANAFEKIDVSQDGEIELEEFISAFKPSSINYPYDLEDAIQQVAQVVDVVLVLADPKKTCINARELQVYQDLYERLKVKVHMCLYLTETMSTQSNLEQLLEQARSQLATRLRDAALKTCPLLWCSNARFESKFENSLESFCESVALKVTRSWRHLRV